MSKLVSAFRVYTDDPIELKTLLLKLRLESGGMDEWVFAENSYTFGGAYKGLVFKKMVEEDPEFAPYKSRITVIEGEFDNGFQSTTDMADRRGRAWASENYLKDLSVSYILNKYGDDTWVSVADADETLDFTDPQRDYNIRKALDGPVDHQLFLPMIRYWYDYDNYARGRGYAILPINNIRSHNSIVKAYDDYLHEAASCPSPEDLVAFEYCQCCSKKQIYRKFDDGPFYYFTPEDFEEAFRCNYWPKAKAIGEQLQSPIVSPDNWFETVELNKYNSPAYVREHLAELKTHNIDPGYKENRKIYFPEWFK
jgi:hypothetical protein